MSLPESLRALDVSLPACPRALGSLCVLLQDDRASVEAMAEVIEQDMALASSVVRTVNSAMFGLLHRVQTVAEAVLYLGTAEVAGITYASALKAAFAPTPAMEALWDRSMRAGLLMGRSARLLGMDAWRAHTAGLFAHFGTGRAAHPPAAQLRAVDGPPGRATCPGLLAQERLLYGATHAALGSALCASWGVAPDVVKFVRRRIDDPPDLGPLAGTATRSAGAWGRWWTPRWTARRTCRLTPLPGCEGPGRRPAMGRGRAAAAVGRHGRGPRLKVAGVAA